MDLWEKKKWLAAAVITCLCLGLSFFLSRPAPAEEGTLRKVDAVEERRQKKEPDGLCVYVSGAVQAPGLYRIPPGERFDYAIRKAGGVTEDADIDRVNLAKKCRDGSHVNVPFLSAAKRRKKAAMMKEGQSAGKTALPDERESGTGETGKGAGPVNVNTASVEELKTLPGVGDALALRIVQTRQQGAFRSIADLERVRGIGPALLKRLRNRVEV